ncbi:Heat shock factor protein [Camponotus floridanus]|uniref:Heat shock factor protein n=1 Tax=Camponotus floridanus TaxID=104421 RepID=E2AVN2_CAMFO|nr:Heat shock factor protein [Camponotus floridanus]
MASFVRQLNMYGFHKKVSVELGGLKCDKDEMEFAHQFFHKAHPYLLEHIKRKVSIFIHAAMMQ